MIPPDEGSPSQSCRPHAADDTVSVEYRPQLLLRPEVLAERVSWEALSHLTEAIAREATEVVMASGPELPGVAMQIAFALRPDGEPLLEIQAWPRPLPAKLHCELTRRLRAIPVPPVRKGPAPFVIACAVGEVRREAIEFAIPFTQQIDLPRRHRIREVLYEVGWQPVDLPLPLLGWPASWLEAGKRSFRRLSGKIQHWLARIAGKRLGKSGRRIGRKVELPSHPEASPSESVRNSPEDEAAWCVRQIARCTRKIAIAPDESLWYLKRAGFHEQLGDYLAAVRDYTSVLRRNPDDTEARFLRARASRRANETAASLSDWTELIQRAPRFAVARHNRALIYIELEAWEAALTDLEVAIAELPLEAELYRVRANLHYARGDAEKALADLNTSIRLDPHCDSSYFLRAMLWMSYADRLLPAGEGPRRVAADLDAAIRIQPAIPEYYAYRADACLVQGRLEEAVADCDKALKLDPECSQALGIRGVARMTTGPWEQVLADCTRAIELGAAVGRVYVARATAHLLQGEHDAALADCNAALKLDPQMATAYCCRADVHSEQEQWSAAIEDFDEAVRLAPNWFRPLWHRGVARLHQGHFEAARQDLDRSIALDPEPAMPYYHRAAAQAGLDQIGKALADLAEAFRRGLSHAPARLLSAELQLKRRAFAEARREAEVALSLDPDLAPARLAHCQAAAEQHDYTTALADLDWLIADCPTMAMAFALRGNLRIEMGQYDRADADYEEAIRLEPGSAEAYRLQRLLVEAEHHFRHERYAQTVARADEALALEADCVPAYRLRAIAFWYSEQLVEAAEEFTRWIDLGDEEIAEPLAGRGQVYAEMGEFADALEDLNRAWESTGSDESSPERAYILRARALAEFGLGNFRKAECDFENSIRLCPGNAWAYYHLGLMYHQAGNPKEAEFCFRLALRVDDPELPPRKRTRAEAFLRRQRGTPLP